MRQTPRSSIVKRCVFIFACTVLIVAQPGRAQRGAGGGEWRHYGGDAGGTKYSPLDQINASNVNKLQIAWRWKTSSLGQAAGLQLGSDAADGWRHAVLHGGIRRAAVAVDAATGETPSGRTASMKAPAAAALLAPNNRGLAYWSDARQRSHPSHHSRLSAGRAGRENRKADSRLR